MPIQFWPPLTPLFFLVKLGFTGLYFSYFALTKNRDCGYALEPPRRGGSNEYPQPHRDGSNEYPQNYVFLAEKRKEAE